MIRLAWFEKNQDHDLPSFDYVSEQIKNKEGYYIGRIYNYPYYMFADEFGEISFVILDKNKKTVVGLMIVDIIKANWYQTRLMIINSKYQQKRLGLKLFSSLIKNNNLKLVSDTKQSDGGMKLWKNLYSVPGISVIATNDSSFTKFSEVELIDGKLEAGIPLYDTQESKKITDKLEVINDKIKDIQDYLDNLVSKYDGSTLKDVIKSLSKEDKEKIFELNSTIEKLQQEKSLLDNEYNELSREREDDDEAESLLVAIPSRDKDFFIESMLYEDGGRVVKGVNTTQDVGVDEIKKQAKKFGNTVNRDGYPPLLNKKARKNTTPNKLYNLGMVSDTISESLTNSYNYNWTEKSERNWVAKSKTDNDQEIEARFSLVFKPHDRWNMGFIVDMEDTKTGKGDQFRIFSTVISIVKDFINQVSPNVLTFSGSRENDGSDSRINLYKTLAYTLTKGTDYKVEKFTVGKDTSRPKIVIKIMKKDFEDEHGLSENYSPLELAIMEGGHTLDEDWKDKLRKAAMVGSIGATAAGMIATKQEYDRYMDMKNNVPRTTFVQPDRPITPTPTRTPQNTSRDTVNVQTPTADTVRPRARPTTTASDDAVDTSIRPPLRPTTLNISGTELESYIIDYARNNGIEGQELIAFMAQIAHETRNFQRMVETGDRTYFNRYEKNHNPETAEMLGNTENGDGFTYRGRGYVQLTGRYNYALAGNALDLDLINNPDLAAERDNAARIAIWYWNYRVARRTQDFSNVETVTQLINGGLNGLDRRTQLYNTYRNRSKIVRNENMINESSIRLKDLAEIKTNFENADFWLWRRNTEDKVGSPTKEFNPEHIGIKVIRTDIMLPDYLYYVIQYLHSQGYFKQLSKGTTRLVNIKSQDVANISFSLNESNQKRILEAIKKVKESEIIDLNKRREDEKLKAFHKDFMNKLKSGVSEMQAAYEIAKEQGFFDDLPVGTRFTLPKGSSYIVKGHTMTGSKTDQLQKFQLEFRKKHNFGPPMFIKGETRFYRPMINAEAVGGEEAGSTMSFELDKLVNFDTGEKRYTKFTGPKLAERKNVDQVKGKEEPPKKSKPSKKGFQDHPYRSRLVGENIGYKVMAFDRESSSGYSLADKTFKIPLVIGKEVSVGKNGLYLSNSKNFVKNYYSGLTDSDEVIVTFEYDPKDIISGNDSDNESEFTVKNAKIKEVEVISEKISKELLSILKENISITGTERAKLAKKKGLEPGTDEWFAHWFSLPYMIDQRKKKNHKRRMGVKPTIF